MNKEQLLTLLNTDKEVHIKEIDPNSLRGRPTTQHYEINDSCNFYQIAIEKDKS